MKTILALLLALSACGDDLAIAPDAADTGDWIGHRDAGPDAAQPQGGCMGNLPSSRTLTISTGDAIPGSLINEIQDMIVGANFPARPSRIFPAAWINTSSGTPLPTCVQNPFGNSTMSWKFSTSDGYVTMLPFTPGDIATSATIEVWGDGVADLVLTLATLPGIGSSDGSLVSVASVSVNNTPASWTVLSLSHLIDHTMGTNEVLILQMAITNLAPGQFLYTSYIAPTFKR